MCGIAGIVGLDPQWSADEATIRRMCQTLIHRGPDDEGVYVRGPAGLGMRRLSIIDLAGGHQPIHNEDQTIWVVLNGEIYNFAEVRAELEGTGHRFYTKSDTEVIVHLYEEFGSDCVDKLRGMFAFALYDERRKRLLLARDRFGKKPLHYALHRGQLLFGSEIKALLAVRPALNEASPEGLLYFLSFGYIPDPHTAFQKIRKLPPGHLLEFTDRGIDVRQYWDLPQYSVQTDLSEQECLEEAERQLSEAVRIRLISDVPLGALLSGGVDSSTVVALMSRHSSGPVKTFSIGFRHDDFDEAHYARIVAKRFDTEHHELIAEPQAYEVVDTLTRIMEEPFSDSSMIPTYLVSQLARKHVTVALAGDAGDELFAGYDRYAVNLRRRVFDWIPAWVGRFYRDKLYPHLPEQARGRKLVYNISLGSRDRYLDGLSFLDAVARERSLLSPDFQEWARKQPSPWNLFREFYDHAPAKDHLSRLLYLDTKTYLTGDILTKVDRMSMATSLEVRAPFMDHLFAEWVTKLSPQWKLRGGQRKYLLKKLAERLGVPREVLYRRKQGFALPLVHWLRNELKEELTRLLLEPRSVQRGYFNIAAIRKLMDEHFRGYRDRSGELWLLLVFELWHRNFLETPVREAHVPPARFYGPTGALPAANPPASAES